MKRLNEIKTYFRKNYHLLFLLLISAVVLVSHSFYISKTQQYPKMDEHTYMEFSVAFYRIIHNSFISAPGQIINYIGDHLPFRQPLYPLILSVVYLFTGLGNSYKVALWFNIVFYIGTIFLIYYLGKFFLSKTASLIASLIFAFYGFSLFYLHFTYSETAATAIGLATLYSLLKTENFTSRRFSIIFAFCLLSSLLTRFFLSIFLVGPIILVLIFSFFNKKKARITLIKNFILIFIILIPGIVFYLINGDYLKSYVVTQVNLGPKWVVDYLGNPSLRNTFSWQSIHYYFNVFAQNTILFYVLFIIGFVVCVLKFKRYLFLLVAFFVPYLLLTFGATLKDDRYIVPIYPIIALISAVSVDVIKKGKLRGIIIFAIVIVGFLNFLAADWGIGPLGSQGLVSFTLPRPVGNVYITTLVWPPEDDRTGSKEIIDAIQKDWKGKNHPVFVSFFNNYEINNAIYTRANYLQEIQYPFETLQAFPVKDRYVYFFQLMQKADYILVKNKNIVDNSLPSEDLEVIEQVNKIFNLNKGGLPDAFVKLKVVYVPLDKSNIIIFKKVRDLDKSDLENLGVSIIKANPQLSMEINDALNRF